MNARLLNKLSEHYVIVMMVVTRVIGSIGGMLTIYYVNLTLRLPAEIDTHFRILAACVVVLAVIVTLGLAQWETRCLRGVLRDLNRGRAIELSRADLAGREA